MTLSCHEILLAQLPPLGCLYSPIVSSSSGLQRLQDKLNIDAMVLEISFSGPEMVELLPPLHFEMAATPEIPDGANPDAG